MHEGAGGELEVFHDTAGEDDALHRIGIVDEDAGIPSPPAPEQGTEVPPPDDEARWDPGVAEAVEDDGHISKDGEGHPRGQPHAGGLEHDRAPAPDRRPVPRSISLEREARSHGALHIAR